MPVNDTILVFNFRNSGDGFVKILDLMLCLTLKFILLHTSLIGSDNAIISNSTGEKMEKIK
jgi:hypothetical protein